VALSAIATVTARAEEFFTDKIEPLLKQHCYECHSHGSGKMKGGLTLDSKSGWEQGGDDGPAIVPEKPDESLLIKMVRWSDEDHKMPPKKKLPDAEIALLTDWVKRGAPDPRSSIAKSVAQPTAETWWSLRPLQKPALPENPDTAALSNPVDRFIQTRLAEKKIVPSPEADRRTLIRRLYYDVLGLPPTPAEVKAFENDKDPQAYDHLVDRLLASPRYGERWARHWLDTIHFAESHGCEHDIPRNEAWRYRDYVVEALNRDTPWPRFVREQLAADRFFPNEPRLMAGLGFLGAGTFDLSAYGTAPLNFEYLDRDDLVTQTMAAFVSTTANCARCHAHKFDPITQEDYYALQAVFAGLVKGDISFDEDAKVAQQRQHWQKLLDASDASDKTVLFAPENEALVDAWVKDHGPPVKWEPLQMESFVSTEGAMLTRDDEGAVIAMFKKPDKDIYVISASSTLPKITALRLEVLADKLLPHGGPGRQDNGNFHLSEFEAKFFETGTAKPQPQKFARATADFNQADWGIEKAIDGKAETAWGIHPEEGKSHYAVFELAEPVTLQPGMKIAVTLKQLRGQSHLIGRFRLSATAEPASRTVAMSELAESALALPTKERNEAQRLALAAHALRMRATDEIQKLPAQSLVYGAGKKAGVITSMGSGSPRVIAKPKTVHLLKRGEFDKPLAEATPGALSAIAVLQGRFNLPDPDDEGARRAALADWIADPNNPLTWRSIANRVWQYHFDRGLCDAPSDFGRMGGLPSHPELLDWLACELRESGGSLKHLHKLILTSATYKQSSEQRADLAKIDGENRLLWRQNRQRLDADSYRDFVCATSGCLDLAMGGPSVHQFNTGKFDAITAVLDYAGYDWSNPPKQRRSIYRFTWRGLADPFMEALDFPDMGLLTPVRGFSASPLQSLSLYNNPFVLHFSSELAKHAEAKDSDVPAQVRAVVLKVLLREPTGNEWQAFIGYAKAHGLAALCRVLLNSNEFLFVN
jgi:mono/diheme cytochrome c family protein